MIRTTRLCALTMALAFAAAGCGPKAVFGLSSDDNNAAELAKVLASRPAPGAQIRNALGKPLLVAVVAGTPRKLVAFDVAAGATLWSVDADVQSRVSVAGPHVVAREGDRVVIRDVATGAPRGSIRLDGHQLVGATTDGDRVYVTTQSGTVARPAWTLAAYAPDGAELWRNASPGALGAPAAQGGLVLSPFLTQWLAILDGATGRQLARIRGIDEEITFVRTTGDAIWYGSKAGVFRLDVRAASGRRADSTYGAATLPTQLAAATYDRDAFDPVQVAYTAFDRKRVLWRGEPSGDGPLTFHGDAVVVHFFRFLFGMSPGGEMRWAYSQPRVELVASAHAGTVLLAVAGDGSVIALDPATGATRAAAKLEAGGPVLGATFDCDGWAPASVGEAPTTVAALVSIARDRDARFNDIKQLAVSVLAQLGGPDVARDLLAIIQDTRTPAKLRETVVDLLVARKDVAGLPVLIAALAPRFDFISGHEPTAVAAIARAIGATGDQGLSAAQRGDAVAALARHADDPATSPSDRLEVVRAMIQVGQGAEREYLRRALLVYRADPAFGTEAALVEAITAALVAGGPEDRETLRYVAAEPRTAPEVAAVVRAALP